MIFYKRTERGKVKGEKWTDFSFLLFFFSLTNRTIRWYRSASFFFQRSTIVFILYFFTLRSLTRGEYLRLKRRSVPFWSAIERASLHLLRIVNLQKNLIGKYSGRDLNHRKFVRINYKSLFDRFEESLDCWSRDFKVNNRERGKGEGRYKSLILTRAEANSRIDYGQPLSLGLPRFLCFRHAPANARRW